MSADANLERLHRSVVLAQPFTPDCLRDQQMLRRWRPNVCEVALVGDPAELAGDGLDLTSLRRIHEHSVAIPRECVRCGDAEFFVVLWKRILTPALSRHPLDKSLYKWPFAVKKS